ncbi:carbohydrate ABC transporter permease [Deinococcus deserti]|uniref:Putative sugar ABC transporter, permease component n=1 Tax=Deinococcus deserti (strain DSM 17065 / CIP 109153 / LMG 22923 / VCD115) TaxID=546414 RepID=C1CVT4_DEIDV|nr:carbohydrate ABC transporter permease [Deinococcus deserti]ACO46301.1 putative sugar ABC transporter, permease component [Deinococcus deserti VCD115]
MPEMTVTQASTHESAMLEHARVAAALKARRQRNTRLTNVVAYSVLIVIALIMLYPFYWTLITSFEPTGNIYEAKLLPKGFSLRNYAEIFSGTTVPFWRLIVNSLVICTLGVTLTVTLAALAAYPLSKMHFPGRDLIFYAILVLMVLPNESGLIVNYITTIKLGLLQQTNPVVDAIRQYMAVVLPGLASIVGLFLLRQAYLSVPQELIEAARIDGAPELTIWRRVLLPLALPTIVAFSILEFVAYWNSFLWARIMLPDKNMMPLSAGLLELSGTFSTNSRAVMAGAVITIIPILIVFMLGQKYFMKGLEGAVKG